MNDHIALFVERSFIQKIVVERIAEEFKIGRILEVVELRNLILRLQVQHIAGWQSYGQHCGYDK